MTKKRNTKRALLMSALSLLICVSMLIGSTFAWFTDSVTSAGNKIQSGTLRLDLELLDKDTKQWASIKGSTAPVFNYDKWEPGYTDVKVLKLENEGNLALKWVAKFVTDYELTILADVIDVYLCTSETELAYPESRDLSGYSKLGTVREFVNTLENAEDGTLMAGEKVFIGIALHMQESAGNDYQNLPLIEAPGTGFDIKFLATQYTYEKDSFNEQYDANAKYPLVDTQALREELGDYELTVNIPEGAPAYDYNLALSNYSFTNDDSNAILKFDMGLVDENGEPLSAGVECPVTIQLPHPFVNMDNFQVLHNGEAIDNATYNKETCTISFTTTGFSPFEIKYIDYVDPTFELEYDPVSYDITKGMFFVNPVDFFVDNDILDKSATISSECIAVDFVKDGVTYYVVSDRATSVFVASDATAQYVGENDTFDVRQSQSGSLYSVISSLQANANSTLYLLPGTYTEGTTINVYSSMDIIGLGDEEDVKVIKKEKSSYSNRHLINVNGAVTREEHVQVTIRNMTLNAVNHCQSSKNSSLYLLNNGAVQAIRLSKVKCYDLIIEDTSYPFYVNGKYDIRGTYLYAQDITITGTTSMVDTANTYKFYYNNVNYGKNGEKVYAINNSYQKNVTMAAKDWTWD